MVVYTHLWKAAVFVSAFAFTPFISSGQSLANGTAFPDSTGLLETYTVSGKPIDLSGPFFQSLGSNGRTCSTCHRPAQGWSISSDEVKLRFLVTQGEDPIFRTVDVSNCGTRVHTSTLEGRRRAYSLLLDRGLMRIQLAVPESAEFEVVSVSNPYGCDDTREISVYRRPLPSTNLRFLSTVMWDGRESSPQTNTQKITFLSAGLYFAEQANARD